MINTIITLFIAIIAVTAVGGLIASNIFLIKMLNRKLLVEKAENLQEVKTIETPVEKEPEAETFEIPAY